MIRILIAEDNEMNREMLMRRLTRRGYEILVAKNGEEAVEVAGKEQPDIILMDMRMPIMDGWCATQELKKQESTQGIPIIGLSANAMDGDKERAIEAGCDDYCTKPVNFELLINTINRFSGEAA